jgi:hypothetical protein
MMHEIRRYPSDNTGKIHAQGQSVYDSARL